MTIPLRSVYPDDVSPDAPDVFLTFRRIGVAPRLWMNDRRLRAAEFFSVPRHWPRPDEWPHTVLDTRLDGPVGNTLSSGIPLPHFPTANKA